MNDPKVVDDDSHLAGKFGKKRAYVAPTILTLPGAPRYASAGSSNNNQNDQGQQARIKIISASIKPLSRETRGLGMLGNDVCRSGSDRRSTRTSSNAWR